jgi:N-acetylmuramoyl-L-alanine amidase
MRKLLDNKRLLVILIFLICFVSIGAIVYMVNANNKKSITQIPEEKIFYQLNGEEEVTIKIGETYVDEGIIFEINDKNHISDIKIEDDINLEKPGEYSINYLYKNDIILTRKVTVLDNIAPKLKLNGNNEITLIQGSKYDEQGYTSIDNIDGDITSKVEISGSVDVTKVGKYTLEYKSIDSSNNIASVKRTIKVIKKPDVVIKKVSTTEKGTDTKPKTTNGNVKSLVWTNNGISIEGCVTDDIKSLKFNDVEFTVNVTNKCYKGNLNLTSLENGEYILYYTTDENSNKIKNQLSLAQKIVRSKIGNKLYTFSYDNDEVKLKIENFAYQYDILIDVGHGGHDPGAVNFHMTESALNLEISKYEKKRFEEHGLRVLMTRNDDTYGTVMGSSSWSYVHQRAYAVGYYGVVSKIAYSNHHNSFPTNKRMGYEIIVTASLPSSMLAEEKKIISLWKEFYPLTETHTRLYTRNYDTDTIKSKANGEVYTFKNYYAMNRIPYEVFNTKVSIYEGCYMSNLEDFTWYYLNKNWIKVSEAKIKVYVESLGLEYIAP